MNKYNIKLELIINDKETNFDNTPYLGVCNLILL